MARIIDPRKIVAISDSHSYLDASLEEIVEKEKPRTLIHLGDMIDKGGDEANKNDFDYMIKLLQKYPDLRFVHVSGGSDSHGPFEIYINSRKNSYTGRFFNEGSFIAEHNIYSTKALAENVLGSLKEKLHRNCPVFVLYGHTHKQSMHSADFALNSISNMPIQLNKKISLSGKSRIFINPGYFVDNDYCTIERKGRGYEVCFK